MDCSFRARSLTRSGAVRRSERRYSPATTEGTGQWSRTVRITFEACGTQENSLRRRAGCGRHDPSSVPQFRPVVIGYRCGGCRDAVGGFGVCADNRRTCLCRAMRWRHRRLFVGRHSPTTYDAAPNTVAVRFFVCSRWRVVCLRSKTG
jgi:hypothetical protein